MTVYLGTLGRMVEIWSTPSAQVQAEDRYSFTTTLEGRRKAQVRRNGRRTWSLNSAFADPRESAALQQFADGAWGNGPFVFVSADAPVSNLLTPEVSTCGPAAVFSSSVSASGPMYLGDGEYAARSLVQSNPAAVMYFGGVRTPAVEGRKITVSAWVLGASSAARVLWYDLSGALVGSSTSTVTGSDSMPVRSYVTVEPPLGAVSCLVGAINATRGAQPAITWSDSLLPWGDGQGCDKAVVHGVTRDQVLAVPGHTYSNVSFTVSEVG